jgi:hypothetical protein
VKGGGAQTLIHVPAIKKPRMRSMGGFSRSGSSLV